MEGVAFVVGGVNRLAGRGGRGVLSCRRGREVGSRRRVIVAEAEAGVAQTEKDIVVNGLPADAAQDVVLADGPKLLARPEPVGQARSEVVHVAGDSDPSLMDSMHKRLDAMKKQPVSIVVVGASGDLAKKKTFPAIFSLFYHDLLPEDFVVYGYARSKMTQEEFRELIMSTLTCRVIDGRKCSEKMDEFLPRCHYVSGKYDVSSDFSALNKELAMFESSKEVSNRLFYLAVPPSVFQKAASNINLAARSPKGYTRVVVEKPFGKDAESYRELRAALSSILSEEETYRIDHYLGKELVQNLMSLRFANSIFEPIWNRNYIQSVQIVFKENFGVEGRAGYFDGVGIIRDIMQNHLLQVLALVAMEPPVSLHAEDIRNEKVKLLRSMEKLTKDSFVIGQYQGKGEGQPGYREDEGVAPRSKTPTFAACVLGIRNQRWEGVPFMMKAGKALDERKAEIRIVFKPAAGSIFSVPNTIKNNELVIKIQPDESIYMRIANKVPGLTSRMEEGRLNMFYREAWEESKDIPDAYERLILDVLNGEKSLFIRDDELEVAWDIFSDAIHELEEDPNVEPESYKYGTRGPVGADHLAARHGSRWSEL
uniref:Glucose-6-phosphate 1-dehydrogenase n=1 Tax=Rhodosorus marinus TaxID=101924 RepID=A0A7S3EG16_9RHOD|mmetsp:Transcript_33448/g.131957  ORF Transcript_33448/g.131957 Transcript_33448/m.131957 type:complete len:595 (+) Transcript_33448:206-1990(+)